MVSTSSTNEAGSTDMAGSNGEAGSTDKAGSSGGLHLEEVRDFVAERLPRAWAPRQVVRVASFPLLAGGKVDRAALAAFAAAETA